MKAIFFSVAAACALSLLTFSAAAQDTDNPNFIPAQITVTPHVTPPKESLESGLGGKVRVKISIDGSGLVSSVDDVIGPDFVCRQATRDDVVALRNAAKEAAMTAKFNPATDKGRPVASSTWLTFTFPGGTALPSYTVKGQDDSAASAAPERMTISSAAPETAGSSAPPPDYKGPVAATSDPAGVKRIPKQISGGVLNGKATSLPKPEYPAAARAVRASGAVSVQVLIDHDGSVFAAQAVAGHPLLRAASVIAACGSRFSPTQLMGQPVRVSGIITYNFVP